MPILREAKGRYLGMDGRRHPAPKDGPTTRPLRAGSAGREVAEVTSK